MKIVLGCYGSRGDVEPSVAVGRELLFRGHDVTIAVPPDMVAFAESVGLRTVAYGLDTRSWLGIYRKLWTVLFRSFWKVRDVLALARELRALSDENLTQMNATLTSLADDADLLLTGLGFEETVANVAERFDIPLVALHFLPIRSNGQLVPMMPPPLSRTARMVYDWVAWRLNKRAEDAQRRELGLPKTTAPPPQRIADRGSLEIQAYDEVFFDGLADEWVAWKDRRPFVGPLTMELITDADDEALSWIAAGTPPICFGFGSLPVASPAAIIEMIAAACGQLGERALLCAGGSDFTGVPQFDHIKVVGAVNYAAVFPGCRAVVHHGGAGTTAAGLRAGVPTLILTTDLDQTLWGSRVKRLKVGTARRFSTTTKQSIVTDLRRILAPDYVARAREVATRMTKPAENIVIAADLVENFAGSGGVR